MYFQDFSKKVKIQYRFLDIDQSRNFLQLKKNLNAFKIIKLIIYEFDLIKGNFFFITHHQSCFFQNDLKILVKIFNSILWI